VLGVVAAAGHGQRDIGATEGLDGSVERLLHAGGDHHLGALVDQTLGDGISDATTGTRDDRGFSFESRAHVNFLVGLAGHGPTMWDT